MLAGKECEPDLGPLHSVIVGSLSFPFFFVVFAIYRVKAGALLATTSKVPIRAAKIFIEFAFGASIHIISLFYSAPRLCPYFITVFFPFFSRWLCPIPEPNNVWCNKTIVSHAVDDGINSRSSNIVPFFSAFDKTNQRDRPHHFFATNSSVSNRKKAGFRVRLSSFIFCVAYTVLRTYVHDFIKFPDGEAEKVIMIFYINF